MIEEILPPCVVAVEARDDDAPVGLFAEEEIVVQRAVEKRRREFATARGCARSALAQLGFDVAAIPSGERGEPLWPAGAVGSITHCLGYRACAAARASEVATIGVDAEPNAALPAGLLADIARPEELGQLRRLQARKPEINWDRLLFSAKESIYKAWFPLERRWLGFEDAIVRLDERDGAFTARLLAVSGASTGPLPVEPTGLPAASMGPLPVEPTGLPAPMRSLPAAPARLMPAELSGRWLVRDGLILTAVVVAGP